jgi:hypothetical protein
MTAPKGNRLGNGSRDGTKAGKAAVELRVSGASYAEVAEVLALSSATEALSLVERELAAHLTPESVEVQRAEASERILLLLSSVMPKAADAGDPEHLAASKVALALIDRHIRLHGLDRPTEVILHTPTASELERWVANVSAFALPDVVEADVIDGDVINELGPG